MESVRLYEPHGNGPELAAYAAQFDAFVDLAQAARRDYSRLEAEDPNVLQVWEGPQILRGGASDGAELVLAAVSGNTSRALEKTYDLAWTAGVVMDMYHIPRDESRQAFARTMAQLASSARQPQDDSVWYGKDIKNMPMEEFGDCIARSSDVTLATFLQSWIGILSKSTMPEDNLRYVPDHEATTDQAMAKLFVCLAAFADRHGANLTEDGGRELRLLRVRIYAERLLIGVEAGRIQPDQANSLLESIDPRSYGVEQEDVRTAISRAKAARRSK